MLAGLCKEQQEEDKEVAQVTQTINEQKKRNSCKHWKSVENQSNKDTAESAYVLQ